MAYAPHRRYPTTPSTSSFSSLDSLAPQAHISLEELRAYPVFKQLAAESKLAQSPSDRPGFGGGALMSALMASPPLKPFAPKDSPIYLALPPAVVIGAGDRMAMFAPRQTGPARQEPIARDFALSASARESMTTLVSSAVQQWAGGAATAQARYLPLRGLGDKHDSDCETCSHPEEGLLTDANGGEASAKDSSRDPLSTLGLYRPPDLPVDVIQLTHDREVQTEETQLHSDEFRNSDLLRQGEVLLRGPLLHAKPRRRTSTTMTTSGSSDGSPPPRNVIDPQAIAEWSMDVYEAQSEEEEEGEEEQGEEGEEKQAEEEEYVSESSSEEEAESSEEE